MRLNVELFQAAVITAAAKNALQTGGEIIYEPIYFEKSTKFDLLGKKTLFGRKRTEAGTIKTWFERCREQGLKNIGLLIHPNNTVKLTREDFHYFFEEHHPIVCYFDKKITCLTFSDKDLSGNIVYTESLVRGHTHKIQQYYNNTASLLHALTAIEKFARKIESNVFAEYYQKAIHTLEGEAKWDLPFRIDLPEENLRIFKAAYWTESFLDGMGSWLDFGYRDTKSESDENVFNELTVEVIYQTRSAFSYAINGY